MKCFLWLPTTALLLTLGAALTHADVIELPIPIRQGELHGKVVDPVTGLVYDADARRAAGYAQLRQYNIWWKQAEAFLLKKEVAKALPLLQKAYASEPTLSSVNELLADIYHQQKRPEDVLNVLRTVVYTQRYFTTSATGQETIVTGQETTQMKYALALLDTGQWEEAVALYTKCVPAPLHWEVPGYGHGNGGQDHTLPDVHFSPDVSDMPALRAQIHLILGSRQPQFGVASLDEKEGLLYMLDHLQQTLKNDRNSLDAQFLMAVVLGNLERYEEAKKAFALVAKNAPRETRPEIMAALAQLDIKAKIRRVYSRFVPMNPEQYSHLGEPFSTIGPGHGEF